MLMASMLTSLSVTPIILSSDLYRTKNDSIALYVNRDWLRLTLQISLSPFPKPNMCLTT